MKCKIMCKVDDSWKILDELSEDPGLNKGDIVVLAKDDKIVQYGVLRRFYFNTIGKKTGFVGIIVEKLNVNYVDICLVE